MSLSISFPLPLSSGFPFGDYMIARDGCIHKFCINEIEGCFCVALRGRDLAGVLVVWCERAWRGVAWHGVACIGVAWRGVAWQLAARIG